MLERQLYARYRARPPPLGKQGKALSSSFLDDETCGGKTARLQWLAGGDRADRVGLRGQLQVRGAGGGQGLGRPGRARRRLHHAQRRALAPSCLSLARAPSAFFNGRAAWLRGSVSLWRSGTLRCSARPGMHALRRRGVPGAAAAEPGDEGAPALWRAEATQQDVCHQPLRRERAVRRARLLREEQGPPPARPRPAHALLQ
eukprot:3269955-Rhodomonas_salina.1